MLAPTPVLKPSPIDIGGLFSGSIEALKRRFGLLALITLMPSIIILVVAAVGTMLMLPSIVAVANGDRTAAPVGLVIGVLVMVVGMIFAMLVQFKSLGMLSVAAYEIAQGQRPDFRGLLARSRGFLPRMAGVIAIGLTAALILTVLLYGLFFGLLVALLAESPGTAQPRGSASALVALGLFVLLPLVLIPAGLYLTTKLLYTVPAVALEGLGGFAAMKRSWGLTRGAFWRTLGYYLVVYLVIMVVSDAVGLVGQVVTIPFGFSISAISVTSSPEQVLAALMTLIPATAILFALQLLVQVVALPFQQSFITYMFIDQMRRSEMPASQPYGYPGGGYYAQPGQYYAQQPNPQQPYPPQGQVHPAQGWQSPAGWTPPGQAQPPQPWGQQYPPPQRWDDGQQRQQPPSGQGPAQV